MKTAVIVILAIALLGAVGFIVYQNTMNTPLTPSMQNTTQPASPTQTQTSDNTTQTGFCTKTQLTGTVQPDVAAGNVYATVTIQNTSQTACDIVGNNLLEVGYPNSVTNFQVSPQGQSSNPTFTLQPGQTVYSLIHYPNGPQCTSMATGVDSMVSYQISQSDSITFTPTTGPTLSIPSCENASEITTIDVYPFSTSPVTP